jgi:hypothetical protein
VSLSREQQQLLTPPNMQQLVSEATHFGRLKYPRVFICVGLNGRNRPRVSFTSGGSSGTPHFFQFYIFST